MANEPLPADVADLIARCLPTMDHVTLLLALRQAGEAGVDAPGVAMQAHVAEQIARSALEDLVRDGLVARAGSGYRTALNSPDGTAVESLAHMYNTRPVTLIRAIYERPVSSAKSFADAFRLRRNGES